MQLKRTDLNSSGLNFTNCGRLLPVAWDFLLSKKLSWACFTQWFSPGWKIKTTKNWEMQELRSPLVTFSVSFTLFGPHGTVTWLLKTVLIFHQLLEERAIGKKAALTRLLHLFILELLPMWCFNSATMEEISFITYSSKKDRTIFLKCLPTI